MKVAYAKDSTPPEPEPQMAAEPEPEASPGDVPEGTTAEILDWVGDDLDRAQRALDTEQANERPRVGLTSELNKILSSE